MPNQATTYGLTNMNTAASATDYKSQIDSNFSTLARLAASFAPHQGSTADMRVYLDPGFALVGTSLTEVGTYTTATFSSGSTSATVAKASGISGTMWITGAGIPDGTTCTISGTTLTLSQSTTAAGSSVPVVLGQRTSAITAPVTYPRIDRIVVNESTGAVSIIAGTEGATPAVPDLTAGVLPVAQVLLQTTTTAITNSLITDERAIGGGGGANNTEATVASASTTDLGATNVNAIEITGTTTISSFGSSAGLTAPYYDVRFAASLTLTYNATSMVLPGGVDLVTEAGDSARFQYLGSGNWRCASYTRKSGANITTGLAQTIASATTTDIGSTGRNIITISGTTTITSLGSSATLDNPIYFIKFSGALTLTYNATSLIVPGKADINTAANDTCVAQYLGSGNWQILSYSKVAGIQAGNLPITFQTSTYAPDSTDNASTISFEGASADATWTLTAASTLGSGWFCYINNPTAYTLTLASSGGNIDGLTTYSMYPGEVRLVQCDGTNFFTVIVKGFSKQIDYAASPFTFTTPPGYQAFNAKLWGGGGGGSSNTTGGAGGGGAYVEANCIPSSAFGSSITITIGAGGTINGATAAGNSTLGSLLTAYGGGSGTNVSISYGAGGGGRGGAGGNGDATHGVGGLDQVGGTGNTTAGQPGSGSGFGGGVGGSSSVLGGPSVYGGAGGAGESGPGGGNSIYGGAGGGWGTGPGGTSIFGGNGGGEGVAGSVPAGGGGRNAAGAAGRVIVTGVV